MGEQIKRKGNEAVKRWHAKMPRFFYWLIVVACGIGGLALSINTAITLAGGTPHDWWTDLYPYIIGASAGTIFCCKFTVAGGFRDIDPDKVLQGENLLKRDAEQPNMSDIETQQPDTNENG